MTKKLEEKQIVRAAHWARENGYRFLTSIVKSYKATTYYHCLGVDFIIGNDGWERCPSRAGFGWHGPVGYTSTRLPSGTISRQTAIKESQQASANNYDFRNRIKMDE